MYKKIIKDNEILVLIGIAILMQLLGNYYAKYFVVNHYFYLLWPILRILIPLFIVFYLKIPMHALKLGIPHFSKKLGFVILCSLLILVVVLVLFYNYGDYFSFYKRSFESKLQHNAIIRFINFLKFTSTTLLAWEFFHRSFLLMGLIFILKNKYNVEKSDSIKIAIAIVWIFETVFHFIKPSAEAFGMLIGSPILSYLAISTRSIWTAFIAHLLVELVFIFFVIF